MNITQCAFGNLLLLLVCSACSESSCEQKRTCPDSANLDSDDANIDSDDAGTQQTPNDAGSGESTGTGASTATSSGTTGCRNDGDCGGLTPRCDSSGECEACDPNGNAGCDSGNPVCVDADGALTCVECQSDGDCSAGTCESGACLVACDSNDDCPDSKPTCGDDHECVECAGAADCDSDAPVCSEQNRCVECASANDCDAERPECSAGECICPLTSSELADDPENCGGCGIACSDLGEGAACEAGQCVSAGECGDGKVQGAEACDDGNDVETDGCTSECTIPGCGDGETEGDEVCDDGNDSNLDECTNACTRPQCGNAVQEGDEECDDGNDDDADRCTTDCLFKCPGGAAPAVKDTCEADDDSNCNGEPNEGCECIAGETDTCAIVHDSEGLCAVIVLTCDDDGTWPSASNCDSGNEEVCDSEGEDEDCDGNSNNGCDCIDGAERECGDCNAGTETCADGAWDGCVDELTLSVGEGPTMRCVPGVGAAGQDQFFMGSENANLNSATPVHSVTLPAFWMDETEVTVGQYTVCVTDGECTTLRDGGVASGCNFSESGRGDYPMNCLDVPEADAFCAWAGKRLPLEEEWEYAARGTDGRPYPWGNTVPNNTTLANWNNPVTDGTVQVARYPAGRSPFGLYDMAGNVREWTASQWCDYAGAAASGSGIVPPCGAQPIVYRGGDFNDTSVSRLNSADRYYDASPFWAADLGFRCARDVD